MSGSNWQSNMQQYAYTAKERCRHTPLSAKIKCILLYNRQKVQPGIHHSPATLQPQLGAQFPAETFHLPSPQLLKGLSIPL